MSKPKKSNSDLLTAVNSLLDQARASGGGNAKYREKALQYYAGEVDFSPMGDDHSEFVSRDVSDTIGLILPGLMRVFFGSNRIVDYNPARQEHEAYHENAADYVNHVLLNKCDGYQLFLYTFFDALLLGNGVIKYWWDNTPETIQKTFEGLTFEQLQLLRSEDGNKEREVKEYFAPNAAPVIKQLILSRPDLIEGIQQSGVDIMSMPDDKFMAGVEPYLPQILPEDAPPVPKHYDAKFEVTLSEGRLKAIALPPESFLKSSGTSLDDDTKLACHWRQPTRSECVSEGYDKKKVYELPRAVFREEGDDRDPDSDNTLTNEDADRSTEQVDIYECYILLDRDGDGVAERWRVDVGGASGARVVLKAELYEDPLPFVDVRTDPIPHQYRGRSITDETDDIQDIKTVLTRGLFDNLYDNLKPQTWVEEGSVVNPDELYQPTWGGVLWHKKQSVPPTKVEKEFLAPKIMPVLESMDRITEKRTGISQNSQALNIEALQNQSATAVNAAVSATFSKIEQYARNLKECGGLKRFFQNVLKLLTKHQDWAEPIKLRKEWVPMRPADWDPDMTAMVNTGLGTGSRERDFAMLQGMAMEIKGIMAAMGPYNDIANIGDLVKILHKMMEAGGISDPSQIIDAVDDNMIKALQEQMKKQPNPAMMQAQQKAKQAQIEFQQKMQLEDKKIDLEHQRKMRELDLEHERKLEEMQFETQLTAARNALGFRPIDTNINRVG